MYVFTPNTLIESAKINANFDEQTATMGTMFMPEIASTITTGTTDTITVSSIPVRKYLRVYYSVFGSGVITTNYRFNSDSGTNYAFRYLVDGSAGSGTSQTLIGSVSNTADHQMGVIDIVNVAGRVKVGKIGAVFGSNAVGTAPGYVEFWFKWINTSDAISSISLVNTGAGDYATDSEIIVTGHD